MIGWHLIPLAVTILSAYVAWRSTRGVTNPSIADGMVMFGVWAVAAIVSLIAWLAWAMF